MGGGGWRSGLEGFSDWGDFESVVGCAIGQAAHASDGVEGSGINVHAVVDEVVADVHVDDLADDHICAGRRAWVETHDVDRAAFKGDGRFGDAWGFDGVARCGCEAGQGKLTLAMCKRLGRGRHLSGVGLDRDIDDELASPAICCWCGVLERVFLGAIGVVGWAEHEHHGICADAIEEREWREVCVRIGRNG